MLIHGLPSPQRPGEPTRSYERLADRISDTLGWTVLAVSMRGSGRSEGNFQFTGWMADVAAGISHLRDDLGLADVWLLGSTTGGGVALEVAAADPQVRGVATIAARADLDDWVSSPQEFHRYCVDIGVIRDPAFPPDLDAWVAELSRHRAVDTIPLLGDRPVLILHGANDMQVPVADAYALAAANPKAELNVITAGDHRLRHDPRAVAVLMGWLDRSGGSRT